MPETSIIITDYHVDQRTGHVTVEVQSKTTEGNKSWDGPKMRYGCDAVAFRTRFNSDPAQFEQWVAGEHQKNHGAHLELVDALLKRKGKVIG